MFSRWLFNVFPRDMSAGWRLVRANLGLWLVLAALAALLPELHRLLDGADLHKSAAATRIGDMGIALFASVFSIPLFALAKRNMAVSWRDTTRLVLRRLVPLLLVLLVINYASQMLPDLGMVVASILAGSTPMARLLVPAFAILIYVGVLVRLCFAPFIVLLHRRRQLPAPLKTGEGLAAPLAPLAWPFLASNKASRGIRWSLVPYVVLPGIAGYLEAGILPGLRIAVEAGEFLLGLTTQAVLFNYFSESFARASSASGDDGGSMGAVG